MNKNFGLFLLLVAFIAVFAVVVMVQVPRKAIVMQEDGGHAVAGNAMVASSSSLTDPGFSPTA